MSSFATREDFEICRSLHKEFGTSYYMASRLFPSLYRRRTDAVYGFVRVPDEWVDNPGDMSPMEQTAKLRSFRNELEAAWWTNENPIRPSEPVLRAFCDVASAVRMPIEEPALFLDAMEMDLCKTIYANYSELDQYMRGSAAAVGVMMLYALDVAVTPETHRGACDLGNAMQLTNFLRDVAEDAGRGRIYLPQDELEQFGLKGAELGMSPDWIQFAAFQANRARALYAAADPHIQKLPGRAKRAVHSARILYSRILDEIERSSFDVFSKRVRLSSVRKFALIAASLKKSH